MQYIIFTTFLFHFIISYELAIGNFNVCDNSMNTDDCEKDKLAFEALKELHNKLDDDKDGGLDPSETDDFARDELSYKDGFERTSSFHRKDKHISKEELWLSWKNSPVYNWTSDNVADWLTNFVHLPQYVESFINNKVDGPTLPRITISNSAVFGNLRIKNAVHRHKISLKAIDIVLFGPPKLPHNYLKDILLTGSIIIGTLGCWFAYIQRMYSKSHLQKMNSHLSGLSRAEKSLVELQKRLEEAENVKEKVFKEKEIIEKKYEVEIREAKIDASRLSIERSNTEDLKESLRLAEKELSCFKSLLEEAESKLEESWQPPSELITLLKNTKELEKEYWTLKKVSVEYQLQQTKEFCDKVKRKQGSLLGPLFLDNSGKMEDVERKVNTAVDSLKQVNSDYQELQSRWSRIEFLLGSSANQLNSASARLGGQSAEKSSCNSLFLPQTSGSTTPKLRWSGNFGNADQDSGSENDSLNSVNLKNKTKLIKPESKFRKIYSVVKAAGEFSKKPLDNNSQGQGEYYNSLPANSSTSNMREIHPRFCVSESFDSNRSSRHGSWSSLAS